MSPRNNDRVVAATAGWQRNLYTKSGLPDNFTPEESFLDAIQRNRDLPRPALPQCIEAASRVSLQMAATVLFVCAYIMLKEHRADPVTMTVALLVISVVAYVCYRFHTGSLTARCLYADGKRFVVFCGFTIGLSPVLFNLTGTISTDTIETTSALMVCLHLLLHGYDKAPRPERPDALSLNAALFASVCLASRLDSSAAAIVLLAGAVLAFVLFPWVRSEFSDSVMIAANAVAMLVSCAVASVVCSVWAAMAVLMVLLFVTLGAPMLFVRWQSYKDTIHGPWDEAVPKI